MVNVREKLKDQIKSPSQRFPWSIFIYSTYSTLPICIKAIKMSTWHKCWIKTEDMNTPQHCKQRSVLMFTTNLLKWLQKDHSSVYESSGYTFFIPGLVEFLCDLQRGGIEPHWLHVSDDGHHHPLWRSVSALSG